MPEVRPPARRLQLLHTAAEGAIKAKIEKMGKLVNGWVVLTSGIGDRAAYAGDWSQRAAVAVAGILANDPAEAV